MESPKPTDETLNKAFQLAYFINGNKETATQIVSRALAKLTVAATTQDKRLYYKPVGRSLLQRQTSNPVRNKVTFSEAHLLQRLIYIESESYEKQKEQMTARGTVAEEDLIIHFIKHLVRITLKRNSFYVAIGISRLLHNYTTAETMGIYNVVIQDPERVKDDYYYRSRKGILMQEMKDRFGDFIKVCHGQRGEERFQAEPNPSRFVSLVRDCLVLFTPWTTSCVIPDNLDPVMNSVPSLLYGDESNEDDAELNRIHTVLHPECYRRLTTALGFPTPEERLELPYFHLSNQNGRNGGENMRNPTVGLSTEELTAIKSDLDELAERRKKASAGFLEFRVDGKEYARLDLTRKRHIRLDLNGCDELIEISTEDGKGHLLLASHLLTFHEEVKTEDTKSTIVLEGGQKLSIDISRSIDRSGPVVDITYRETDPFKATSRVFERLLAKTNIFPASLRGRPLFESRGSRILTPIAALLFLLMVGGAIITYVNRYGSQPVANVATKSTTPEHDDRSISDGSKPQTSKTTVAQQNGQSSSSNGMPGPQASRSVSPPQIQPRDDGTRVDTPPETGEEATRSVKRTEPRLSLNDVRSVFVEFIGTESSGQLLRDVLAEKLRAGGRLTLSKGRDEADAVLRLRHRRQAGPTIAPSSAPDFTVQLINAQGQVIWPLSGRSLTYSGRTAEDIASKIAQELFADIQRHK